MNYLAHWRRTARRLRSEIYALYLAFKDPRVPWYARVLVAVVVAYAFSPIDLIPDFIPILGYLDDVILLPFGVFLAIKLIPPEVMAECRTRSSARTAERVPANRVAATVIILTWILLVVIAVLAAVQFASS